MQILHKILRTWKTGIQPIYAIFVTMFYQFFERKIKNNYNELMNEQHTHTRLALKRKGGFDSQNVTMFYICSVFFVVSAVLFLSLFI